MQLEPLQTLFFDELEIQQGLSVQGPDVQFLDFPLKYDWRRNRLVWDRGNRRQRSGRRRHKAHSTGAKFWVIKGHSELPVRPKRFEIRQRIRGNGRNSDRRPIEDLDRGMVLQEKGTRTIDSQGSRTGLQHELEVLQFGQTTFCQVVEFERNFEILLLNQ